jgi:hypothetical protein
MLKLAKQYVFVELQKICWPIEKVFFSKKIVTQLSAIWICDPESRQKFIPDPGVKKAPDLGSGSASLLYRVAAINPEF